MGTIPAPNIFDAAQQISANPQNRLAEFARVAGLEQQTKMLEQQTQGAALENQQRRQAMADQQATTDAFLNWDHKDPDTLAADVVKRGGSAAAGQAIQQHYLGIRKTASDIAKQDSETGAANLKTKIERHNQTLGQLRALNELPDEEFPAQLQAQAQQLSQSEDPDERGAAQHIAALSQMPTPDARKHLQVIEHGLMGEKEIFDEQQKLAEQAQKDWKEAGNGTLINTKTGEVKEGTLPLDRQEFKAYMINPDVDKGVPINKRDAATFLSWKAKQNPSAVIAMSNLLGKGGEGTALDQQAENYFQTGQLPAGFGRSPQTTAAIIKRANELHAGESIVGNKGIYDANVSSLRNLQKNFDQVSAFENTAGKNLDLFLEELKAIPDLGAKFANVPLRMIDEKMIGSDNWKALKAAQQTAAAEAAKVLSSANASGVLSDTQKKEAEDVLDLNMTFGSAKKVVETLHQDFSNRHTSYQQQIADIKTRIKGGGGSAGSSSSSGTTKVATRAHISGYAKAKGIPEAQAEQEFKSAGYTIQ